MVLRARCAANVGVLIDTNWIDPQIRWVARLDVGRTRPDGGAITGHDRATRCNHHVPSHVGKQEPLRGGEGPRLEALRATLDEVWEASGTGPSGRARGFVMPVSESRLVSAARSQVLEMTRPLGWIASAKHQLRRLGWQHGRVWGCAGRRRRDPGTGGRCSGGSGGRKFRGDQDRHGGWRYL